MKIFQEKGYETYRKNTTDQSLNMALLNEERRRLLKLPPLTPVDYNCIERAATKLKLIVDTLTVKKRMSGLAIVYKDLTLLRMHR